MLVLVTGATGFVGRRAVAQLRDRHHRVRCLVHTPGRERAFTDRSVEVHYGSVSDPAALTAALGNVEAVIHLVGVIRQRPPATFDGVNRLGVANVVAAAREAGVQRFVQISAIGAANNPHYRYLYSKWRGEQEVINSGIPFTILRPSIMFGEGDEFVNLLAGLIKVSPVVPVAGSGRNRFQPIAVEDVARCAALAVERPDLEGKTVEIGGPQQLSYNEIIAIIARTLGRRHLRLHVPVWLLRPAALIAQRLQARPVVTTDQLRMLGIQNVAGPGVVEQTFGFTPRPLEGNIDYVRSVSFWDGARMSLGFMPAHIRDH